MLANGRNFGESKIENLTCMMQVRCFEEALFMIQMQTVLNVADNSGAKRLLVLRCLVDRSVVMRVWVMLLLFR